MFSIMFVAKLWRNYGSNKNVLKASTSIFYDKRHPKIDGTCAISIRVTFNRQKKYYRTGISLTTEDFEKVQSGNPRKNYKDITIELQTIEAKAVNIIKSLPHFTWPQFEKQFLSNQLLKDTLAQVFKDYSTTLRNEERIGIAESYECAAKSLEKFSPNTKFIDVTPEFLSKYERYMLSKGSSITTVGIYLRSLRAIFNLVIKEGIIPKEYYPFGKGKYDIPTAKNKKKALLMSDIGLLFNYQPQPGTTAEFSKDLFIFMYLCNGLNPKDLALLRFENIKGSFIEFQRAKTVRTKRVAEQIKVALTADVETIINKHGNKNRNGSNYIFPILQKGLTADRQRQLIKQFNSLVNDHMKIIAEKVGIKENVTTIFSRHSYATIMKRSGVSTSFIQGALGHSTERTTQNYLANFQDEIITEAAKALTAFKK